MAVLPPETARYRDAFRNWLLGDATRPADGRRWLADNAVTNPAVRPTVAKLLVTALNWEPAKDPFGQILLDPVFPRDPPHGPKDVKDTLRWRLLDAVKQTKDFPTWSTPGLPEALQKALGGDPSAQVRVAVIDALAASWAVPKDWLPFVRRGLEVGLADLRDNRMSLEERQLVNKAFADYQGKLGLEAGQEAFESITVPITLPDGSTVPGVVPPRVPSKTPWGLIAIGGAAVALGGLFVVDRRRRLRARLPR
jgi:hypothetical protein